MLPLRGGLQEQPVELWLEHFGGEWQVLQGGLLVSEQELLPEL
ncbi:hypothetical protein OLZ33_20165 [Pantoea ananatis]|nr:hypothetical protein [Pantoea ananatis]MCW1834300.1 hypothetical protein [Pantoea ananatis]